MKTASRGLRSEEGRLLDAYARVEGCAAELYRHALFSIERRRSEDSQETG